jgi:voltage-gated sodium channel
VAGRCAKPFLAAIIGLIFYVAAVIATKLFAADFPEWFGSLGASAFTLFQVMTLESWAMGIVRPVMAVYPAAWIFFLVFILASTFTLLNLFIAVIVNAIQSEGSAEVQDAADEDAQRLRAEMNELRAALLATQAMLVEQRKES